MISKVNVNVCTRPFTRDFTLKGRGYFLQLYFPLCAGVNNIYYRSEKDVIISKQKIIFARQKLPAFCNIMAIMLFLVSQTVCDRKRIRVLNKYK